MERYCSVNTWAAVERQLDAGGQVVGGCRRASHEVCSKWRAGGSWLDARGLATVLEQAAGSERNGP